MMTQEATPQTVAAETATSAAAARDVLADATAPADHGLYEIPLARIRRNPRIDPRQHRNKARYERMCESFKAEGIIQPITVRVVERDDAGADLEVVAGNTRFDGAVAVGHTTIPALVRHINAREAAVLAGTENMERQDLSPVEEGIHAARLLSSLHNDHEEVMKVLGWSRTKLDSRILLTHVTDSVQDALVQGDLKIGHVELLSGIPKDKQDKIATKIVEQGYSVATTREKLSSGTRQLDKACFDLSDCTGCQFNSSTSADLFATSEDKEKGFCSNEQCWADKTRKQLDVIVTDAKEEHGTVHLENSISDDSFVALETNGENGVGAEQKAACLSCEHYGAVVSEVFGKEGTVQGGMCFNLECHGEKVTAYRRQTEAATQGSAEPTGETPHPQGASEGSTAPAGEGEPAQGSGEQAPGKPEKPKKAKKDDTPLTPETLKKGIKHEAMTQFRTMGQDAIASEPNLGVAIALLTLFQSLDTQHFPDSVRSEAKAVIDDLHKEAKELPALNKDEKENYATLLARLPASLLNSKMGVLGSLTVWSGQDDDQFGPGSSVKSAILYTRTMQTDPNQYVYMTSAYMKAQVKAALIADCKESGFEAAYDAREGEKAFSKLAKGKARELIEAIEAFDEFDWHGYVPTGFSASFYDL